VNKKQLLMELGLAINASRKWAALPNDECCQVGRLLSAYDVSRLQALAEQAGATHEEIEPQRWVQDGPVTSKQQALEQLRRKVELCKKWQALTKSDYREVAQYLLVRDCATLEAQARELGASDEEIAASWAGMPAKWRSAAETVKAAANTATIETKEKVISLLRAAVDLERYITIQKGNGVQALALYLAQRDCDLLEVRAWELDVSEEEILSAWRI